MCAQFLIQSRVKDLASLFGGSFQVDKLVDKLGDKLSDDEFDLRILPYNLAPILVRVDDTKTNSGKTPEQVAVKVPEKMALKMMNFSLVPRWSKEAKVKFATHNARIETVAEKPTWKRPFQSQRCLVPISKFIEPIYINDLAGNMVQFFDETNSMLWAAGVWDSWVNRQSGEVLESFAILTDEPPEYIKTVGHDRCPIFLKTTGFTDWLSPEEKSPQVLFQILNDHRDSRKWATKIDRPLAKGWERRIPKDVTSE